MCFMSSYEVEQAAGIEPAEKPFFLLLCDRYEPINAHRANQFFTAFTDDRAFYAFAALCRLYGLDNFFISEVPNRNHAGL